MSQIVTLSASNNAYKGASKPYVAALTGLDRKFGFEREFMPRTAHVTDVGLYEVCNYDKKDRKDIDIYLVVAIDGGLEKIAIRDETAVEILKDGRSVTEIAAYRDPEGKLRIRAQGTEGPIMWRSVKPVTEAGKLEDLERLLAQYVQAEDISLTQREFLQAIVQRIQADL